MKKITITCDEENEVWNMVQDGVNDVEVIGILAMFMDNVRYKRIFKVAQYFDKMEESEKQQSK